MIEAQAILFMLVLTRVVGFVVAFPLFASRSLPRTIKVGVSLALTAMWFTVVDANMRESGMTISASTSVVSLVLAMGSELLVGIVIGFAFGLCMLPTRIAGAYIAQEMGLGMAAITAPNQQEQSNALAQLLDAIGVLLFFALDMHQVILCALHASFERLIVGQPVMPQWLAMIRAIGDSQEAGLVVAAPVGVCLFVTLVVLLLLSKAAPQLNLFSVGLTVRLAAGLAALMLFIPDITQMFQRFFLRAEDIVYAVWQ